MSPAQQWQKEHEISAFSSLQLLSTSHKIAAAGREISLDRISCWKNLDVSSIIATVTSSTICAATGNVMGHLIAPRLYIVMLVCHRKARQKSEQNEVDFRWNLILRAIKLLSGLGDSIRGLCHQGSWPCLHGAWTPTSKLLLALSCRFFWTQLSLLGCLLAKNPALLKSFKNSSKVLFPFFLNPSKERCMQLHPNLLAPAVAALKALWNGAEIKSQTDSKIQWPSFPPNFHSFHHCSPSFLSTSYYVGMCGDGANDCGVRRSKSPSFISLLSTYRVKRRDISWHSTSQAFPKLAHTCSQSECC